MTKRNGIFAGIAAGGLLFAGLGSGVSAQETETAIFAGGCFWCVEADFDHVEGVLETTSGFIGGTVENPTYQQVTFGDTGHYEAVRITYDPARVSYDELLNVFWHSIDPTDAGGQFCDRGPSYRTAIFATTPDQLAAAQATKAEAAEDLGKPIATTIVEAPTFYEAEGYHQDYYQKNALKYKFYRTGCGRNDTVRSVWGEQAFAGIKDSVG